MKVTVRTPAGLDLATASLLHTQDGLEALLDEVPRSNGLLMYYFGKNGRKVVIEGDRFERFAQLSTRYQRTGRTWHIALTEALPAVQVAIARERMTMFPIANAAESNALQLAS